MKDFMKFLDSSYTAWHAVENAQAMLDEAGFIRLYESESWNVVRGGKYYVVRGGSSLVAFKVGEKNKFTIVASHTDSPSPKVKDNPVMQTDGMFKLNVESYGGGINHTFFDRPLKLAGRLVVEDGDKLVSKTVASDYSVVIPSLAVHMDRDVNEKFGPNYQTQMCPLLSLAQPDWNALTENAVAYDLFAVSATPAFLSGANGEFLSAPRIDNLSSVYYSVRALIEAETNGIAVTALFNNEEVGSGTPEGAGGDFMKHTLKRIFSSLGLSKEDYYRALPSSILISLDNAHSEHPNYPEKCDPTNRCKMGKGIVVKAHANKAYLSDGMSIATVKHILKKANVAFQNFYNRSDMRSGSTLGALSNRQVSIPTVDLGLAQLAMHSAVETVSVEDCKNLLGALVAVYGANLTATEEGLTVE